jgi:hypothetical protein
MNDPAVQELDHQLSVTMRALNGEMGCYYTEKPFESGRMVLIVLYCS